MTKPLLHVWVPIFPPSSNQIYEPVWVNGKPKGKRLTTNARRFKVRAMQAIQKSGRVAVLHLKEHIPYELRLAIFFEKVINKGYPNNAKDRYAKIDATNRVKLLEDTAADAVGLDDRHNFRIIIEKHCNPEEPGIYVTLREIPEEEVGLTKEAYERLRLQGAQSDRAGGTSPTSRLLTRASRSRSRRTHKPARRDS